MGLQAARGQLDLATTETLLEAADTLARCREEFPKGRFQKLEQALGIHFSPVGMLFAERFRHLVNVDAMLHDAMHVYLANGVGTWQLAGSPRRERVAPQAIRASAHRF